MKNLMKKIQNPKKIILHQEKVRNQKLIHPVSFIKNNNTNKIIDTPITNNKKDEINNSAKSKEPEDNYINDEKIESIDDLARFPIY